MSVIFRPYLPAHHNPHRQRKCCTAPAPLGAPAFCGSQLQSQVFQPQNNPPTGRTLPAPVPRRSDNTGLNRFPLSKRPSHADENTAPLQAHSTQSAALLLRRLFKNRRLLPVLFILRIFQRIAFRIRPFPVYPNCTDADRFSKIRHQPVIVVFPIVFRRPAQGFVCMISVPAYIARKSLPSSLSAVSFAFSVKSDFPQRFLPSIRRHILPHSIPAITAALSQKFLSCFEKQLTFRALRQQALQPEGILTHGLRAATFRCLFPFFSFMPSQNLSSSISIYYPKNFITIFPVRETTIPIVGTT